MLASITGLIASIASLVTAVGGAIGMLVVARRTSPRERNDAARNATEQVLNPPSRLDAERTALEAIPPAKKRRRRRG